MCERRPSVTTIRDATGFKQRAFNEAVIDHGSIAVKLLRKWEK
jgi:hypothetical protein